MREEKIEQLAKNGSNINERKMIFIPNAFISLHPEMIFNPYWQENRYENNILLTLNF
ncbi:hypothetical protein ACRFAY_15955 [Bacteroides hominis]|uniref:hypothetical protein n=1 Tax=Bacteroides TaxID=816 RepID=UPI0002EC62F1|nr:MULTISPECIES: hypothetical protein [Bacteroides]MBE7400737.1 hypothetical protein [Bacteroides fragilis]MCE8602022.1 hypothetical protein [Bacteroides fragilis]MCE8625937.1 hypothetical protein [Bacteroides fragilis]MCE8678482.1 hypothetical protein [Bacteroides fragilis]MCE8703873.1 hypothetical protein [Bacteroides fragilis]